MSAHRILESIDKSQRRQTHLPEFRPGDSIKVWAKIREGEKTRLQAFEGVCIRRVARGARSTFTVRKISYGVGVERIFPDNSPNLYYLRDLSGKAARIKEREGNRGSDDRGAAADAAPEASAAAAAAAAEAAAAPAVPKVVKVKKERKKEKPGNKK